MSDFTISADVLLCRKTVGHGYARCWERKLPCNSLQMTYFYYCNWVCTDLMDWTCIWSFKYVTVKIWVRAKNLTRCQNELYVVRAHFWREKSLKSYSCQFRQEHYIMSLLQSLPQYKITTIKKHKWTSNGMCYWPKWLHLI